MGTTCAFSGTGGQSWPEPGMEEKGRELVLCSLPPTPCPSAWKEGPTGQAQVGDGETTLAQHKEPEPTALLSPTGPSFVSLPSSTFLLGPWDTARRK